MVISIIKSITMDRKKIILTLIIVLLSVVTLVLIFKTKSQAIIKIDPAFKEYISGFTSGIISTESTIKVRLNFDAVDSNLIDKPVEDNLFSFSPGIDGKAFWIDSRTIEFRPQTRLSPNTLYTAKFFLSKIINITDSLKTFVFQFHTIKQAFEVSIINHKTYDKNNLKWEKISGSITMADDADIKEVEQLMKAEQNGKKLKIRVQPGSSAKNFLFTIDSVERTESKSYVEISWNGKPIDAENKGTITLTIPSINEFLLLNIKTVHEPEQYINLQFSDPINPEQELNGLVSIGTENNLKFIVEDNEIKVIPLTELNGTQTIVIHPGIKNLNNKELGKKYSETVTFEDIKPDIRLVGSGTILPSTNGLLFPFEAVNVNAVDVSIFKIYENNVPQFLQVNRIDGSDQLTRVGKIIFKKTISLQAIKDNNVLNMGNWTRYFLDLNDLIKTEPGAIYRVNLGIRKAYSTYAACDNEEEADELAPKWDEDIDSEPNQWYYLNDYGYYYDDYEYDYYYYYDWSERDDPCSESYYYNRAVSRNILATDVGIIAKVGTSGELTIFTTDIVKAQPLSGSSVFVYDYQNQVLHKGTTNGDGKVVFQLKKVPYLIVAQKGSQRSYIKLTGGSSLSLSTFDVEGQNIKKGVKGFIYAERGVWRPGDSIFLTFILEDKLNKLSPETPVIFTLNNPRGQKVQHIIKTKSVNGFYDFRTATDPGALTGFWNASIQVGGSTFNKSLSIETIKPNRLKINLTFGSDKLTEDSKGTLESKWLHGTPARNLKADVSVTLNKSTTVFSKYSNYVFDDPSKRFYSETFNIFSDNLNEEGKAEILPGINLQKSSPGVLKAAFETRVFENGGEFSIDRFTMWYYPYSSYVGLNVPKGNQYSEMLETEKEYSFNVVNVNKDGFTVGNVKLKVDVYKVNWRWWWDRSSDDIADFVRSTHNEPYKSLVVNTVQGKGQFKLNIPQSDYGRYFIRVYDETSGHSTGKVVYFDWNGWSWKKTEGNDGAGMLMFSADKEKYQVGETVNITIPSSKGARILITLETGTKILQAAWINSEDEKTAYSFKVSEEMAPNIYVSASLIQPHGQTANDLPLRLYGVIPVMIEDPNTHLRPVITMNDVIRPEENASITIREENGKAMTYTIAVVDEGLLDLTKFKTPDPWNYFYAKEALGVKSWDVFDDVIGAYNGQLERILSIGGGEDGEMEGGAKRANRFKPVVKFFGPFALPKGSSKTLNFKVPLYTGSVRVMVVAGQNGAYGNAEKTVAVRKPLMLLATLPRVVGPGETVTLPVNIFAMEKHIKNVSVSVSSNEMFSIADQKIKNISFKSVGDDMLNFQLKVKETTGIGKVIVSAKSGNETAKYEIEIEVRNSNPETTEVIEHIIQPGKSVEINYSPFGMPGTNKGIIECSSMPPINLQKRLKYLITYPYGCIEQTTSAAFPQLYLSDFTDTDENSRKAIERNVKAAISRINAYQTSVGGFSYWPGGTESDEWGTCYAGHFLLEAQAKGYTVSSTTLRKWKKYQKRKVLEWSSSFNSIYYNYDMVQAYRLYTLALANEPELGAMNLLREQKNLSTQAAWRLAAAYHLAGQTDIAKKMVQNISTNIKPYKELWFTYGTDDRDRAMIVEALSLLDMKVKAVPLVKAISEQLSKDQWMSTQTTAYCLLAISKFVTSFGDNSGTNFTCTLANNKVISKTTTKKMASVDMELKKSAQKGKCIVKNNGKGILYVRMILSGIPTAGEEKAADNNLKIDVVYKNTAGKVINPSKLMQGTDFIAEVSLHNPGVMGYYYNMALAHIVPSGWEIHNTRLDQSTGRLEMSAYNYQDFRDDRVYTFFNLASNEKKTYKVLLNASYLGRFYLPTINCAAMYDESIYARTKGQWVEVVPFNEEIISDKK